LICFCYDITHILATTAPAPRSPIERPDSQGDMTPDTGVANMTAPRSPIEIPRDNTNQTACTPEGDASSVVVDAEKPTYTPGQAAFLFVSVFDKNGCPMNAMVTIDAISIDSKGKETPILNETAFSQSAFFSQFGINLPEIGDYKITATAVGLESRPSFTHIKVIPIYETSIAVLFSLSVLSFAGLMIVTSISKIKSLFVSEILRFIFISGLVSSVIAIFIFIQDEFGRGAPLGIVLKPPPPFEGNQPSEWVINIGGVPTDGYTSGIQIPVYVFIFGIAGGYLRYLYKTARLRMSHYGLQEMYLFSWNDVPGRDSNRLKEFLRQNLNLDWIKNQEFNSKERTIKISENQNRHSLSITLNNENTYADVTLDNNSNVMYQFVVKEGTDDKLL
jgi:hypothetical protein